MGEELYNTRRDGAPGQALRAPGPPLPPGAAGPAWPRGHRVLGRERRGPRPRRALRARGRGALRRPLRARRPPPPAGHPRPAPEPTRSTTGLARQHAERGPGGQGWARPPGPPELKERWKSRCGARAAPGPPRSRAPSLLRTAPPQKWPGYTAHRSGRGTLPSRASPARSEARPTTSVTSVATPE